MALFFFKTNLSTGWDCPRAEVMMSFRHAEDHTYIAQLLGRMVRTPLAHRVESDASLNDVHLFLPYFDTKAVTSVVDSLHNAEDVPPAETGLSRDLVILNRRPGTERLFESLGNLVTYRVNAIRAQSNLRRYIAFSRNLTIDELDDGAWDNSKQRICGWIQSQVNSMISNDIFEEAKKQIANVGLRTLAVQNVTGESVTEVDYQISVSEMDIDRLFEDAGRSLSHGLHNEYWQLNFDRDPTEVKIEVIVVARNHQAMAAIEADAEVAFTELYDNNKRALGSLREQRRVAYEKLRIATAKPSEIPWHLPESIDFRRLPTDPLWEKHIYIESTGDFKASLGTWEADILNEELRNPQVKGWLRNVDRKQWSLEIPYHSGGEIRPMFPDLVVLREAENDILIDILEPHDSSLADNFEKAQGLASFAESHGHMFGRIQLIRKVSSAAGGERYLRLEINNTATIKKLLLITTNPQLDNIFEELGQ